MVSPKATSAGKAAVRIIIITEKLRWVEAMLGIGFDSVGDIMVNLPLYQTCELMQTFHQPKDVYHNSSCGR